jgi:hypothetical protein
MMAASMNRKRKNAKATTRGPPRKSARIEEKLMMWDRLRNTEDVMHNIYSFLSVHDRVRIAEVDKTFRDDEARGRVVTIYGDHHGLDLLEAFETIKKWHDYEMSPRYQMKETPLFRRGDCIEIRGDVIEIKEEWYTPEGGWDIVRIMVRGCK